jgi:hypothetical protein
MDEEIPFVVVFTEHHGRYCVEFDYDPAALQLLKKTVPAPMRHWIKTAKRWEVSTDWIGPLASAFVNAGIEVLGLNHSNIVDWFAVFSTDEPTRPSGHDAYRKGLCKRCESVPHRPGGTECEECFRQRLIRQHRVKAAMAEAGATRYPEALPAGGSARTTRYPLEIDRTDAAIVKRDHAAVLDILITAEPKRPDCLICGRHGKSKFGAVHVICRTRLLRALDGRPFTKVHRGAYQDGLCPVCFARPHLDRATCTRCAEFVDICSGISICEELAANALVESYLSQGEVSPANEGISNMNQDRLRARYEEVSKQYDAWNDFTDRHPYPSGMKKLLSLGRELDWLRSQLDDN